MAAPRKDEERERLYGTAMDLFAKNGYNKTTYSDISRESSISKSMVQHYFPKKDLFVIAFFDQHLEKIAAEAEKLSTNDPLRMFSAMGLLHFDILLNDDTLRLFYDDIVTSRELTSAMVDRERTWAKQRWLEASTNDIAIEDALTVALGGAYELLFQSRKSGTKLTATYLERAAIVPFAMVMGYGLEETERIIVECAEALDVV